MPDSLHTTGNSSGSINSAIAVAAAFLLLHFLNEFTTALVASYFGLKPIMYLQAIRYNAYDMWTPYNVKRTFIASGIMNFVFAFIFYRFFMLVKERNKWYRIFFLWCATVGIMMFLGKLLSVPFYEFKPDPPGHIAFGVVAAYQYWGQPLKWLITVFSVLLMIAMGLFLTYQFLRTAESKDQLKKGTFRRAYIIKAVFLPYLAGMFVAGAVNFPNNIPTILIYFFVGLVIIVSSMLFSSRTTKVLLRRGEPQKLSYFAMGMLAFLMVFYLFIFEKGIGCKGYLEFLMCCGCKG